MNNNTMALVLTIAIMFSTVAVLFASSRSVFTLYALAAVVSLVGINIHLGVTIYLTRMVIIFFLISILTKAAFGKQIRLPGKFLSPFIKLFSLTLLVQFISTLFSEQVLDGFRQIFIYISLMAVFITVIIVGTRVEVITKAVNIYLVIGLLQGLYGMYQVIGGPFGWPTYQALMGGIPTANDRTVDGFYYTGAYQSFRATGFFPADVSHYAGYMAGVLILAIALLAYNRRSLFLYAVIVAGIMGLLFSLSRSGMLAFFLFGIPTLSFLLWRIQPAERRSFQVLVTLLMPLAILGIVVVPVIIGALGIDLTSISETISTRLTDLVDAGGNENESMGVHILTRLMALDAWASSPLLGVGLGVNASPWFSEYYQAGWAGSHSHHLDILGQTGLIGAGLEWLFMGLVARYMWRGLFVRRHNSQERNLLAGLLATFITIVLGNLLYHYYINEFVWFLMGCGVALSRSMILDAYKSTVIDASDFSINIKREEVAATNTSGVNL